MVLSNCFKQLKFAAETYIEDLNVITLLQFEAFEKYNQLTGGTNL